MTALCGTYGVCQRAHESRVLVVMGYTNDNTFVFAVDQLLDPQHMPVARRR